jgi:protein-tyrosine phosphatase
MCRQAKADGIEVLVATPHFNRGIFPTPQLATVHSAVTDLRALCEKALIYDFDVGLGADCHVHPEIIENLRSGMIPTLSGSRYLLLELPSDTLPPGLTRLLFDIQMAGTTPIITHPERNRVFSRHPGILRTLIEGGAYAQLTAGSLTGLFGSSVRTTAEQMLECRLVQMIASDAHDPEHRPPVLSEGREAAASIVGDELAWRMVEDVPRAVIENKVIRFPNPTELKPARKSVWRRIVGK